MLIGIDGRPFYGLAAGTGRYVTELCRQLDEALPEASFRIYANRPLQLPVQSSRWEICMDSSFSGKILPASVWFFVRAGRFISKDKVDVFWGAANFLPLNLPASIPSVLTVYDFVFRLFSNTLTWKNRLSFWLLFGRSVSRANKVVAISQGTADRLREYYGRNADSVVRPAAAPWFSPPSQQEWKGLHLPDGVKRPYILSVATLEPRKNLDALINALLLLRAKGELLDHTLVLVGQKGWRDKGLKLRIEQARRQGLPVRQLGFVPDKELPMLYAAASVVVMPSLYEGFGMPVLEAISCGACVVASDIPEIREAGGAGAIYVTPDVQGIADGLRLAIDRPLIVSVPRSECPGPSLSWVAEGARMAQLFRSLT